MVKDKSKKYAPNSQLYDKLFAIYLTPKALNGLKQRGDNFSKIVKEAKKLSKRKLMHHNNLDLN